jgi:hypothetical protein
MKKLALKLILQQKRSLLAHLLISPHHLMCKLATLAHLAPAPVF